MKEIVQPYVNVLQEKIACAYLSAMIDAEGSVINAKYTKAITIWNTELEIITKCCIYLEILNIRHSVYKTKRRCKHGNLCYVNISGKKNLTNLYDFLKDYMCSRKLEKLQILLTSYKLKNKY